MNRIIDHLWNTKWILTLTAGLLLGLSFPPFPFPFLTFPAFLCLFRLIDLSSSAREAAFRAYPGFLLWNIIATYWLMLATLAGGIAAILANAAVMTIPVMLQYKFQRSSLPSWLIALLQTAAWLSFEYLHHHWDLAWPWLTAANAWSNVPVLLQYISITGFWGASFWIIFTAALAYQAIQRSDRRLAAAAGSCLVLFPLFSLGIYWGSSPSPAQTSQEVIVTQPNFDSYQPYGGYPNASRATRHLLQLSDSLRSPDTELIVWPENAIQSDLSNRETFGRRTGQTRQVLQKKARQWNTAVIAGATYFEFYSPEQAPALPYYTADNRPFLPFNAAVKFAPGEPVEVYRKHNLVPIVERVPYVHFLAAIDIFDWVNWNRIQKYGKGQQANAFSVGQTKTPALICYDSVYPSWIRKFVQQGAGYLTVITNDGWWGNTSGHLQHFAYARLRAIEFDRWVVRSANNGISGIIAPDGSIKKWVPYKATTAFRYSVPVLTSQTVYARFGDWLPRILMVLLAGGILYLVFVRTRKPDERHSTS